jgi:hypothetical protein
MTPLVHSSVLYPSTSATKLAFLLRKAEDLETSKDCSKEMCHLFELQTSYFAPFIAFMLLITKWYSRDQIEEDEIGGACGTYNFQ